MTLLTIIRHHPRAAGTGTGTDARADAGSPLQRFLHQGPAAGSCSETLYARHQGLPSRPDRPLFQTRAQPRPRRPLGAGPATRSAARRSEPPAARPPSPSPSPSPSLKVHVGGVRREPR
jgi:hypothetical protein